ncbi:MAG: glycosyltransferase [Gammaproteobacteria bacterium]|jgi:glycosyltransferase involved in cell wall biosynthesis
MRILTFTSLFPNNQYPNSAVFIKNRMAAVNDIPGVEVRVVAPVPWFPRIIPGDGRWQRLAKVPDQERIADLDVQHPRYVVTPKIGMSLYGKSMYRGSVRTVEKLYKAWPFDLIDAHYVYPDGLAAMLLGHKLNIPVVVSARGTDMNLYPSIRSIAPLIKQTLKQTSHQIAVSQSLAEAMWGNGAARGRVAVIPNGIDPQTMQPVDTAEARRILQLEDPQKSVLISVGNLVELKGHHLLIQALGILKNKGSLNFSTYIIGRGGLRAKLQQQIDGLGLSDLVHLVGEVDNARLKYWYSAADISFLGSSREGWPNVVSESLACGTPVVATNVNGIPEILTRPEYGLIVERNVDAFVAGIEKALSIDWDRKRIAADGQLRSWGHVAREVIEVFKNVLEFRREHTPVEL